ncbi:MAG: nucleoside hydrolase, partial [Pseudomonas sp.]
DMQRYGLAGGPVHDACVIAYLLRPELFTGKPIYLQVDSREGPTYGQSIADYYNALGQPSNVMWVDSGDAQGFFDVLSTRLARLK